MKNITLPKLPYGQGSYSWYDIDNQIIRYKKPIPDTKPTKYLSVNGSTIQECNRKMKEKEKEYNDEVERRKKRDADNAMLTFAKASYNWMSTFKAAQLKGKSYDTVECTYNNQIVNAPFANYQTESITDMEIQEYLNYLKKKNFSQSTVKKTYEFFSQFFRYYYRKEPYSNPMISVSMPSFQNDIVLDEDGNISDESKSLIDKQYEVLSDEEIDRFTNVATLPIIPGVQGYNHGWGLVFIMWSFIRYGEAIALQWKDINFEEKYMLVYKTFSRIKKRGEEDDDDDNHINYKWALSTTKTKNSVRKIPMCDQAINALQEYKKLQNPSSENSFVFSTNSGQPVSNSNMNTMLRRILVGAGIKKHVTIHGLRHTGISYFLRHKVDKDIVSKMAGHGSLAITEQVYYTILSEQQKEEIDKINKLRESH